MTTLPGRDSLVAFVSLLAILLGAIAGPGGASAQASASALPSENAFRPQIRPALDVAARRGGIEIDGELNDPGWTNAVRADRFTEVRPGDQTEPPVDTEALITYDEKYLYVAFIAHDDPRSVRSSMSARDEIFSDDYVGILFDTYGDATWYYELFMNPLGIQGDLRGVNNGGEDSSFDIVFDSRGRITASGYQVEMAVPFESLRFPNADSQSWRLTFWRNRPREKRSMYSWAAIDRDEPCFPCQFGTVSGIKGLRASHGFELLPTFVGTQSGELSDSDDPGSSFDNTSIDGDASIGLRYAMTSSLAGEATVNPDFSQIESDAAQIDVNTTFALFFPERRPFFQDGGDLFQTWYDAVYTRSINDPVAATKLTGTLGRTAVAFVGARDERSPVILPFEEQSEFLLAGKSTSNILRARQSILEDSFIGALVTDRRLDGGGGGSVMGADMLLRFMKNYQIEVQALTSRTAEPSDSVLTEDVEVERFDDGRHTAAFDGETFWGDAIYASLERNARRWNFDFDYWGTSPTFRADNGFVTQNDSRQTTLWSGLQFNPNGALVESVQPSVDVGRVWNYRGERKDEWVRSRLWSRLTRQTELQFTHLLSNERFHGTQFDGIRSFQIWTNSKFSEVVNLGAFWATGRSVARREETPVLGHSKNFEMWGTIKPTDRFVVTPSFNYSHLEHPDDGSNIFQGYILRTRINYQFTRELFMRLVLQYDEFDQDYAVEPLLTYQINPFTVFYLGSTHAYTEFDGQNTLTRTSRQFFLKLQYFFRV